MKLHPLNPHRRKFVQQFPWLCAVLYSGFGCQGELEGEVDRSSSIKVLDQQRVYVDAKYNHSIKPVPPSFTNTQFKPTPELPDEIPVFYSDVPERTTKAVVHSLHRLGAMNEGVYREGNKVLQIVATTPGTPDTKSGSPLYKNWYRLSFDHGSTFTEFKLIVTEGKTAMEPIEAVKIGRNGYTYPFTCPIVKASNGEIMVPINLHPWDEENQKIYNPADAFLFGDSGVLIGRWTADGQDIEWHFGEWLRIDHRRSTRGLFEPSIIELKPPGRFAMVMRGSNYTQPDLPAYTWLSFSEDFCRTWSKPQPFGFSDGSQFYAPASCSTLFRSLVTKELYWIGNVLEENSNGNHPRNPLMIAKVDEENFGLIKSSMAMIDERQLGKEGDKVELSNYKILYHGQRDEIVVALVRRIEGKWAEGVSWYQIKLS